MSTTIKRLTVGLLQVIGIVLMISTFSQAQPMRMTTEERVKMLKDSLQLNDKQAEKITKILDKQSQEMNATFEKYADNRDSMRTAMQGITQKYDKQIIAVLTKIQAKKYDVMQAERRKRMGMRNQ